MCLAIPAKIIEKQDGGLATVDILGTTRDISLDLTPAAEVGDYVLVHAGFAIEVVDEQFAEETIDLIREFPDLAAEDLSAATAAPEGADATGQASMGAALSALAAEI